MEENNKQNNNNQISATKKDLIKVKFDNGSIKEVKIASIGEEVNPEKGLISAESPLGRALLGSTTGEKRKYKVLEKEIEVEILEIKKTN